MSDSTQDTATPPLLLRTNPAPDAKLPYIDSPESLVVAMSRMTKAYFAVDDFPHDAINTSLFRIESLAVAMQCHLDACGGLTPKDLSNIAWTVEGLAVQALALIRMWGRHGAPDLKDEESAILDDYFN